MRYPDLCRIYFRVTAPLLLVCALATLTVYGQKPPRALRRNGAA